MTPIFIYYFIRYLYINTNIKLKRMYRKNRLFNNIFSICIIILIITDNNLRFSMLSNVLSNV